MTKTSVIRPGSVDLWAWPLAVIGILLIVGTLVPRFWAELGGTQLRAGSEYAWNGGALYATTTHREAECTIVSPGERPIGEPIPTRVGRGGLTGVRLDETGRESGTVTCTNDVSLSGGPIVMLYPLASGLWGAGVGAVLAAVGVVYGRSRRT